MPQQNIDSLDIDFQGIYILSDLIHAYNLPSNFLVKVFIFSVNYCSKESNPTPTGQSGISIDYHFLNIKCEIEKWVQFNGDKVYFSQIN
jgi:hypothetical protein